MVNNHNLGYLESFNLIPGNENLELITTFFSKIWYFILEDQGSPNLILSDTRI